MAGGRTDRPNDADTPIGQDAAMHEHKHEHEYERACRRHWRINLILTALVLMISAGVSFIPPIWARTLMGQRVSGLPLPFYMGTQGAMLVYVVLVAAYAILMHQADGRWKATLAALPDAPTFSPDEPFLPSEWQSSPPSVVRQTSAPIETEPLP